MNPTFLLLLECLLSVLLSLAILRRLSPPLGGLLEKLCPDAQSAAFWRSYTQLMLTLAPLLCVLLLDPFFPVGNPAAQVRFGLMASLGGMLLGLWIIGRRLGRFIDTAESRRSGS